MAKRRKSCSNKECRSTGDAAKVYAKSLCSACYRRAARASVKAPASPPEAPVSLSKGADVITGYLAGRIAERRRKIVCQLLDEGADLDGVLEALLSNDEWRAAYIDTAANPLATLRRDVAMFEEADKGKSKALRECEATIRMLERKIADPALPATAHARLIKQLADSRELRARLAGEIMAVTGRGIVVRDDDSDASDEAPEGEGDESDPDRDAEAGRFYATTVVQGEGPHDYTVTRRPITWIEGFKPQRREPPDGPYRLPNVEGHALPEGCWAGRGDVIENESGAVVGRYVA